MGVMGQPHNFRGPVVGGVTGRPYNLLGAGLYHREVTELPHSLQGLVVVG